MADSQGLQDRLREICLGLPEAPPTWFVRDESVFVTLWEDGHHRNFDVPHLWCAAPAGA